MQLQGLRLCLEQADNWDFNVFDLEREADGLPLQVLSWHVFCKHGLIEEFNLDHVKLVNFLRVSADPCTMQVLLTTRID